MPDAFKFDVKTTIALIPGTPCPLCGCPIEGGQHGIFEWDPDHMCVVVCRPSIEAINPRTFGVITGISE